MMLASCSKQPPFAMQDIAGLLPPLQFQLMSADGHAVSAENYRGKIVLLYFGYTNCPDVCPTTLARLAQAVRALGPESDQVRVLFVSVDPRRDSAPLLKRYAGYFGPQVVGLTGDDEALSTLARRCRVVFHRDTSDQNGNYAVEHSSAVFVFDRQGRARLLAGGGDQYQPRAISADLRRLLSSG